MRIAEEGTYPITKTEEKHEIKKEPEKSKIEKEIEKIDSEIIDVLEEVIVKQKITYFSLTFCSPDYYEAEILGVFDHAIKVRTGYVNDLSSLWVTGEYGKLSKVILSKEKGKIFSIYSYFKNRFYEEELERTNRLLSSIKEKAKRGNN